MANLSTWGDITLEWEREGVFGNSPFRGILAGPFSNGLGAPSSDAFATIVGYGEKWPTDYYNPATYDRFWSAYDDGNTLRPRHPTARVLRALVAFLDRKWNEPPSKRPRLFR